MAIAACIAEVAEWFDRRGGSTIYKTIYVMSVTACILKPAFLQVLK